MTREEAQNIKQAFYDWLESNFSELEIETIMDNVMIVSAKPNVDSEHKRIVLSYLIETRGESFVKDEENDVFYFNDEPIIIEYRRMTEPIRPL